MKIFVADDHSLFRDGIISLLEAGGHEIIGQAGDGKTAVEKILSLRPDLALLDINMPLLDGLGALREIKAAAPGIKVVMLTVSEEDAHLLAAIRAGAAGYLLKHLNSQEFLQLLDGLERGEPAVNRSIASQLFKHIGQASTGNTEPMVSERELAVLKLVAAGKSNRDTALALSVSENTIKFHLKNIMIKLNTSNRTEAVMVAKQRNLI